MRQDQPTPWYRQAPNTSALPRGRIPSDAVLVGSDAVPLRVVLMPSVWVELHPLFDGEGDHVGLLLGHVYGDDDGPFIAVDGALAAPETILTSSGAAFTEHSWESLRSICATRYPGRLVVGSFRMRPGGGTSLSPYDRFNAERWLPGWHQLMYVLDSTRQRQSMYHWHGDRLESLAGFWICRENRRVAGHGFVAMPAAAETSAAIDEEPIRPVSAEPPHVHRRPTPLAILGLLLLILVPWACVPALPGSLPAVRRHIDEAAHASRQLADEVESLRRQNESLRRSLGELGESTAFDESDTLARPIDSRATSSPNATAPPASTTPVAVDAAARTRGHDRASGLPSPPGGDGTDSAASQREAETRYVIREGDTLWSISGRLLGDPRAYAELAEDNDISDPDIILPGWELRLPEP